MHCRRRASQYERGTLTAVTGMRASSWRIPAGAGTGSLWPLCSESNGSYPEACAEIGNSVLRQLRSAALAVHELECFSQCRDAVFAELVAHSFLS